MTVSMEMIRRRLDVMARKTKVDFELDHGYGGYRVVSHRGSRDVSPRLKKGELVAWLDGFWSGIYKQY